MLSPIEVKKQDFNRSLRGYDPTEVRSFLETVAIELERLNEVNRKQSIELEKMRAEVSTFQRIEQNMKDALVNAQESMRGAREESKREADLLKREAKLEAENIFREAYTRAEKLNHEIESLVIKRDSFIRKWRSILNSELEMLLLLEEIYSDERAPAEHEEDGCDAADEEDYTEE